MAQAAGSTGRLAKLYGEMSSLEAVLATLSAEGVDPQRLRASDIYTRGLDCQNLGTYPMLDVLAGVAAEYGSPRAGDKLLDIGCGLGGPGRFLADRFGCSVVGTDLLPVRTQIAGALTRKTGLERRISYRVADATELPFRSASFAQAWMLDVSIHIRNKLALFAQIARVLRPGGLLVMHDQTAPIPEAMRPITRRAPYIAPSLAQLIRTVDAAGLRVLTWRDTTGRVLEYFEGLETALRARSSPQSANGGRNGGSALLAQGLAIIDGYIETLAKLGGRTGILVARRSAPAAGRPRPRPARGRKRR